MKKDEVPQHDAKAFQGRKKALYAQDEQGRLRIVPSSGWEAEEIVLDQAIAEFEAQAADALARARRGQASALEYHMYRQRMDVVLLAQSTGYFRWRVKRHLRPDLFARLPAAKLARYADALGLSVDEVRALPPGGP
ncbi:MAG: hypothetical protein IPK67_16375 [Planctomycetes bacterium]|nr:hypothetical protein [Planctomycetota bacterium]